MLDWVLGSVVNSGSENTGSGLEGFNSLFQEKTFGDVFGICFKWLSALSLGALVYIASIILVIFIIRAIIKSSKNNKFRKILKKADVKKHYAVYSEGVLLNRDNISFRSLSRKMWDVKVNDKLEEIYINPKDSTALAFIDKWQ